MNSQTNMIPFFGNLEELERHIDVSVTDYIIVRREEFIPGLDKSVSKFSAFRSKDLYDLVCKKTDHNVIYYEVIYKEKR